MIVELTLLLMILLSLVIWILVILNVTSLIVSKTTFFRQYYMYKNLKPNIEKLLNNKSLSEWKIRKISWWVSTRMSKNRYKVYVKIKNYKIISDICWTNNSMTIDEKGNIIEESLTNSAKILTEHAKFTDNYDNAKQINITGQ